MMNALIVRLGLLRCCCAVLPRGLSLFCSLAIAGYLAGCSPSVGEPFRPTPISLPKVGQEPMTVYSIETSKLHGVVVRPHRWGKQWMNEYPMLWVWTASGVEEGRIEGFPNHVASEENPYLLTEGTGKVGTRPLVVRRSKWGSTEAILLGGQKQPLFDGAANVVISPGGAHYAYFAVSRATRKQFVVIDGVKQPEYDRCTAVMFSPDGKRWAYRASDKGRNFVVVDGTAMVSLPCSCGPAVKVEKIDEKDCFSYTYSDGGREMLWSPDSRRLAYILDNALKDGGESGAMFIDNSRVSEESPTSLGKWSADGSRYAYPAYCSGGDKRMVLDGQSLPVHDDIRHFAFSPDGKKFAYFAWDPDFNEPACRVFCDGVASPRFAEPAIAGKQVSVHRVTEVVFSPDSRHLAYVARREKPADRWYVVMDGKASKEYDDILTVPVWNGDVLRYIAVDRGEATTKVLLVVDRAPPP
jgi:hypothetical protein